ncbi:uncharacterized protein PV09_03728 [Verruconis gallopava]|uniref:SMP-30/Gluconolactonase/LRE-like region domain-containing protein n=1 Tax=Verruconis gallopava TaxID=253628 RepID=A0A0D2B1G5_9PEZI|nr:uncharacterized protein PV09_03728 [Verruconis gallopava]KIW05179.1 hypothetical protein PV09_03728 [Verruconis gallopava]
MSRLLFTFSPLPLLLWWLWTFISMPMSPNVAKLYEFPRGAWIENIAVRGNGNLVVVRFDQPEVFEIEMDVSPPRSRLIARFEEYKGIQGIAEIEPDIFAVMPFKGSTYSLWTVNLGSEGLKTEVISHIPDVGMLNGLTKLSPSTLLASDTKRGAIMRLDIARKSSSTAIKDDSMAGLRFLGIGINGVRVRDSMVYYTNLWKGTLCKISVNPITATQIGTPQVVATNLGILDDLAIDKDNQQLYVMQYLAGTITRVQEDGTKEVVAKGLKYITSAQFGRREKDRNVLYVSSSGNPLGQAFKGAFEGGKVYAVHLE